MDMDMGRKESIHNPADMNLDPRSASSTIYMDSYEQETEKKRKATLAALQQETKETSQTDTSQTDTSSQLKTQEPEQEPEDEEEFLDADENNHVISEQEFQQATKVIVL
jgi:hypothetical protein